MSRTKIHPQTMIETHQERRWLLVLALILIGFAVYSNSLTGKFIWDDQRLIQRNPDIKNWSNAGAILTTTLKGSGGEESTFYRPVQMLTYLIDYSIWRLNPFGYHLTNAFFHLAAGLAVFWLIHLILKNEWISFGTALFFLIHPVHTEAVAYISGRADSLAALFMFLAFGFYLKAEIASGASHPRNDSRILRSPFWDVIARRPKEIPQPSLRAPQGRSNLGFGTGSAIPMVVSYALALLSRENSLILPVLIVIYHVAFKTRVQKKSFALLILTVAIYLLWRFVLNQAGTADTEAASSTLFERIPGFLIAFFEYLRLLLMPIGLHMEYGGILFEWNEPKVWLGLAALIAIAVYASKMRNREPALFFSSAWYLAALVPVSNLYPINAYMAEHWLYVPSVGFFLALTHVFLILIRRKRYRLLAILSGISLFLFYSVQTLRTNWYWHDPISFYERLLRYAPHSSRVYNNLAEAYYRAGKQDRLIALLEEAVRKAPENYIAFNNLGNAYKNRGYDEKAKTAYEQAIQLNPRLSGAYSNLGQLYWEKFQDRDQAVSLYQKAIEADPAFPKAYHLLGILYLKEGKSTEAVELFKKALSINPDDAEIYHSLGFVHVQQGNLEQAKIMYQKAIELNPRYGEAYHDLAVIHLKEGNVKLARQHAKQAANFGLTVDEPLLEG